MELTHEAANDIEHVDHGQRDEGTGYPPVQLGFGDSVAHRGYHCHLQQGHRQGVVEVVQGEEGLHILHAEGRAPAEPCMEIRNARYSMRGKESGY